LGYYWFNHPNKGIFKSNEWQKKSIFSLTNLKFFVLNVPGTYPAWKINGEMITGMMSPSIDCYPQELKYFIRNNWIIDGRDWKEIFKAFEIKKKLFLKKINGDFDLLVYVIRLPDVLSHCTHLNLDRVTNYIDLGYQKIDNFIGEILNYNNIDNILIFSDHGLKYYQYEFNMRRWLEKKGLLFINNYKQKKIYSVIARLYDIIRPFIKIDYKRYYHIKKSISESVIKDKISTREQKEDTRVLNFCGNFGGLYLKPGDKIKKNIIKKELEKDKNIKKIISSEINGFPDLFIILKEKYLFNHESSFFVNRGRNSLNHKQNGFFFAYGKNVKKGTSDYVSYKDIAPTILRLFGINKLDHMIGESLNIFKN
jgi:predicted AlkP superfamily phosphohydrolase/phosphomutase